LTRTQGREEPVSPWKPLNLSLATRNLIPERRGLVRRKLVLLKNQNLEGVGEGLLTQSLIFRNLGAQRTASRRQAAGRQDGRTLHTEQALPTQGLNIAADLALGQGTAFLQNEHH
ncbi:hypothetical protein H1C71_028478, partial [Ictidomys tridecemlineatus]